MGKLLDTPEDQQEMLWLQMGIGKGVCDCGSVSSESGPGGLLRGVVSGRHFALVRCLGRSPLQRVGVATGACPEPVKQGSLQGGGHFCCFFSPDFGIFFVILHFIGFFCCFLCVALLEAPCCTPPLQRLSEGPLEAGCSQLAPADRIGDIQVVNFNNIHVCVYGKNKQLVSRTLISIHFQF